MLRKLASILMCLSVAVASAQTTTVSLPNTITLANVPRIGVNTLAFSSYGNFQSQRNENLPNSGYVQEPIYRLAEFCSSGGTTNTTTSWYNNTVQGNSNGYAAGFFVGATFRAISQTGTLLGTGTVTASTANTGSTGITFTLSPAINAACNINDVLMVDQYNTSSLVSAYNQLNTHCSGCSIETTDLDPASTNTSQALELAANGTAYLGFDASYTDSANSSSTSVYWLNLNGTGYQATFKAKSLTSGATLQAVFQRGGITYVSQTVTPTYNTTPGAGWQTYTFNFNATESGAQNANAGYNFYAYNGNILLQDMDIIEPAVYTGNTTSYRDAFFSKGKFLDPSSFRFMGQEVWCSSEASMWGPIGMRSGCGINRYLSTTIFGAPVGIDEELQFAYAQNTDAFLTLGNFWTAAEMTAHMNQMINTQCSICGTGQTWQSLFLAKGLHIHNEFGNESWNTATGAYLLPAEYGYIVKQEIAAARAVSGYNSAVMKLDVNGWGITSQSTNGSGWTAAVMTELGCVNVTSTPALCPDYMDYAPYTLLTWSTLGTAAPSVTTDEVAEVVNDDSTTSTSTQSNMKLAQSYLNSTYGVNAEVYEYAYSPNGNTSGATNPQVQQVTGGVGMAMNMIEHALLMQRDALIPGPIHYFGMGGSSGGAGSVGASWNGDRYLACGPGQISTCQDVSNPIDIAISVVNNAIGINTNLWGTSQSGTPTFSYAGGQSGSIPANSAVPYVNVIGYCHGSSGTCDGTGYTLVAFNHDQSSTHPITLSGAGAPQSGTVVTTTIMGGSTNTVDQNNSLANVSNQNLSASPYTPPVVSPTPSTSTGTTSFTLQPASMTVLTYALGSPQAATPVISPSTGTYSGAQTVTITDSTSGAVIHYTLNGTTPTAASPVYDVGMTVASTGTIKAIAIATGYTNSAVATSTLTISNPVSIKCAGGASIKYAGGIVVTCSTTP